MTTAWHGDWAARIYRYIHARGFASVTELASTRPLAPTSALAQLLGKDVAAIQIENLLYAEAERHGRVEQFARDLLVRRLREAAPAGWGIGEDFDSRRAAAYSRWLSTLEGSHRESAEKAWQQIRTSDLPDGWLPEGPDDPIIERAFAGVWFDAPDADG